MKSKSCVLVLVALLVSMLPAPGLCADPKPPEPVDALPPGATTVTLTTGQLENFAQTLLGMLGVGKSGPVQLPTEPPPDAAGAPGTTAGGTDYTQQNADSNSVEEYPLPGYPLVTYKTCGHTRLTPAIEQAMGILQNATDPQAAVSQAVFKIQAGIDQVNAAVAAAPVTPVKAKPLEPGNQYAAAVQAVQIGQQPNCDVQIFKNAVANAANQSSPLVLDINGNGKCDVTTPHYAMTPAGFVSKGAVMFDLTGRGRTRMTEWLQPHQDGLLVLDVNVNGVVDSASELFGDSDGYKDGYAKLSTLDRNGDGVLTGSELSKLSVWIDNGDGVTQPGELKSVAELGITAIEVHHKGYVSGFTRNGRKYFSWDWFARSE